jgi:hypothetical protein
MTLSTPGAATSVAEVTSISALGFWLLVEDREYFVPFDDYPTFRQGTVAQIYYFEHHAPDQIYWPELDVDIDLNALAEPDRFPLSFQP